MSGEAGEILDRLRATGGLALASPLTSKETP
jgi:hypothetical protein